MNFLSQIQEQLKLSNIYHLVKERSCSAESGLAANIPCDRKPISFASLLPLLCVRMTGKVMDILTNRRKLVFLFCVHDTSILVNLVNFRGDWNFSD